MRAWHAVCEQVERTYYPSRQERGRDVVFEESAVGGSQYTSTSTPSESFLYDADGNLTHDDKYDYTYDAENRLRTVTPYGLLSPQSRKVQFILDPTPRANARRSPGDRSAPADCVVSRNYLGRCVRKLAWSWSGTQWGPMRSLDRRYVYDGRNVLLELDGLYANNVLFKYTWGLDLAGLNGGAGSSSLGDESPHGFHDAGGIGGLLAMTDTKGTSSEADDRQLVYFCDANGNVGQLIDSDPNSLNFGTIQARYEYYPFGGILLSTGTYASLTPYKFSTKRRHDETATYDFGLRDHNPRIGRFLERDPIEEQGGWNLYAFVGNSPVNAVDPIGQYIIALGGMGRVGDPAWRATLAHLFEMEQDWYEANLPCRKPAATFDFIEAPTGPFLTALGFPDWSAGQQKLMSAIKRYDQYRRKLDTESGCSCPEILHILGFSDGATTIAQWMKAGAPRKPLTETSGGVARELTLAPASEFGLIGLVDLVRTGEGLFGSFPNLNPNASWSADPALAGVDHVNIRNQTPWLLLNPLRWGQNGWVGYEMQPDGPGGRTTWRNWGPYNAGVAHADFPREQVVRNQLWVGMEFALEELSGSCQCPGSESK